jgi:hypothetical protein
MRQCLVVMGVMLVSACASSSSSSRISLQQPPPVIVAVPLPQCTNGEPRAVEAGLPRCTCVPEDKTMCTGGDCSCVTPESKSDDSLLVFLLGLAVGAL